MYMFGSGRGGGVEWMRGLGLGFTNPGVTEGKRDMCLVFWLRWCGWCWRGGGKWRPAWARVVVRLPRPMEGNGATPIFRSLQNCQFHHRRLESLEHFNVLYIYIYYI